MEEFVVLVIMACFYAAYFYKQYQQRQQGITTMVLGEGNSKPEAERRLEFLLKIASFTIPVVEVISIWWNSVEVPAYIQWIGIVIEALGCAFFILGMTTMNDSWRAGIPDKKETSLVTSGIYNYSRNPAFVGFDLMYIGILLAFPNVFHAICAVFTIILFDKQIKNEEVFLQNAFGEEYIQYKNRVRRYL